MSQKEVEMILTRQLASYLSLPIFMVDSRGTLAFYNEPAEKILGQRFEETGEMPATEWSTAFQPTDKKGQPLPPQTLPLMRALTQQRPAHGSFWIRGADGIRRYIEVTAFPLIGQAARNVGAVAVFWEGEAP